MSRLSNKQFLLIHDQLKRIWLNQPATFARLSAADQFHLHLYFQPDSTLPATDLISHRQRITAEQPHLPQKAGRARTKLLAVAPVGSTTAFTGKTVRISSRGRRPHNITVRALMNPAPDAQRFARIVLDVMASNSRDGHEDSNFTTDIHNKAI